MSRLLSLALLCAGTFALQAQHYEFAPTAGILRVGRSNLGSLNDTSPKNTDTHLQGGTAYGARLTLNSRGYWGVELGYLQSNPRLYTLVPQDTGSPIPASTKITTRTGSGNVLMYMMPSGERWRPYLTAGGGATQFSEPNIVGWTRAKSRNYGFNYGAGLKIKLIEHVMFRLDFRDYLSGKPYDLTWENNAFSGGWLHQREGTFGLAFGF